MDRWKFEKSLFQLSIKLTRRNEARLSASAL